MGWDFYKCLQRAEPLKLTTLLKNGGVGTFEVAQWVKAFAVEPNDLSSIPGTHMVDGEDHLPQAVF